MQTLSYSAHEVYTHDRDLFFRTLFVPAPRREVLATAYALIVELERIFTLVSEEMIGHIRYAWWEESLQALYAGNVKQGHPVLEALALVVNSGQLPQEVLLSVVDSYRNSYPAKLSNRDEVIKNLSLALISESGGWIKADGIIIKHRKRYGHRLQIWLMLKLLFA